MGNVPLIYLFLILAILAAILSRSNKRSICVVYVVGLCLELLLGALYGRFDLFERYWDHYYLGITLVCLFTLSFMSYCYHKDYFLVYPLIFLMLLINGMIVPEWILMGTTYILSISKDALEVLNVVLLLILFGMSDGTLRLLDDLWLRILFPSNAFTRYFLRLYNHSRQIQNMEK